ncbi:hypothetical protein [Sphingobium yanoikuyae]|uniref:hypothetical protein n=1 Tax=Sphingobium yanoikuyae TaxID=13690 RepID=UPI003AF70BC7
MRVGNAGNATIGDEDGRMIDRLAGQHIDHMVRSDDHLLGKRRRGSQRQQDGGGHGRCPDSLQHAMQIPLGDRCPGRVWPDHHCPKPLT